MDQRWGNIIDKLPSELKQNLTLNVKQTKACIPSSLTEAQQPAFTRLHADSKGGGGVSAGGYSDLALHLTLPFITDTYFHSSKGSASIFGLKVTVQSPLTSARHKTPHGYFITVCSAGAAGAKGRELPGWGTWPQTPQKSAQLKQTHTHTHTPLLKIKDTLPPKNPFWTPGLPFPFFPRPNPHPTDGTFAGFDPFLMFSCKY